ncbi:RtcB family protein [Methanobrevibacter curvatus]|uniref:tRNA-splicing ligase RtcB n=1 Tax=Methanobrevibacter curvatus TaxID=49547 RepID=A0A165ZNM7_9EURY|nr:RtcB family protein [Methanobrevibacter curvatus]KZX10954.1 RNA-splicing ligase RtcB [Methanobrevibacter curvatus]
MSIKEELTEIHKDVWELPSSYKKEMLVPARLYLDDEGIKDLEDGAIEQVSNVACLPGIQSHSIGLPDMHFGYGFSIGGVGAFSNRTGVVSPGGVGFDINCGVRMLRTNLTEEDIRPVIKELNDELFRNIPSGVGSKGKIRLDNEEIENVLDFGAYWAVANGYGWEEDLEFLEENGKMEDADSTKVSDKAKKRGIPQLGSLGSGNHFLEIQKVDEIFNEEVAKKFALEKDSITVMIHTGSRGCGHQVCSDYLRLMDKAYKKYSLKLPDRQLACAPADSNEAQDYFKSMAAAANYAWANRQMIQHWVRESFETIFKRDAESMEMSVIYDVAHNIAKKEVHKVKNYETELIVHRKGATRAFGPGRKEVPSVYKNIGQPVLIPGTMGTSSYILHGTDTAMKETFGSTAHGAGRKLSRTKAKKLFNSEEVKNQLQSKGIHVKASSQPIIAEESPDAYKNVDHVVKISDRIGLAKLVGKVSPIAVIKG